jgi:hypothetical protein
MKLSALILASFRALTSAAPLKYYRRLLFVLTCFLLSGMSAVLFGAEIAPSFVRPVPSLVVSSVPLSTFTPGRVPVISAVSATPATWQQRRVAGRPVRSVRVRSGNVPRPRTSRLSGAAITASYLVAAQLTEVPLPPQKFSSLWFEARYCAGIEDAKIRRTAFIRYYQNLSEAHVAQRNYALTLENQDN